ncbi:MAG: hypothetical protein IPK13_15115 [Deltaproteobacteria bacterium]|nr:hypothetical protein [Deltaproteobacteria bacterium]
MGFRMLSVATWFGLSAMTVAMAMAMAMVMASCTAPAIDEYEPHTGIVTGTLLYQVPPVSQDPCMPSPVRGNIVVFLVDVNDLPPPEGSGSPVNFVVVPEASMFGVPSLDRQDETMMVGRIYSAPFTLPTVPAGTYQVRAFLDADGDFVPTVDLLAQPTAGDVVGGHVDGVTGAFLAIEVEADRETSQITVNLGRSVPVERPAFSITSTTTFNSSLGEPGSMVLAAHPIARASLSMIPDCSKFLVQLVDADGDGEADDVNEDHLPDVFPRVTYRRIDPDVPGEQVIVPGAVNPYPFLDALLDSPSGVLAEKLEVVVLPIAYRVTEAGIEPLERIPDGTYETIVIAGTGQTWTVPNDLDALFVDDGPDASQAAVVTWRGAEAAAVGHLSGNLKLARTESVDAVVLAFDERSPPPPEGGGRPVGAVLVHAREMNEVSPGAWEATFDIGGLRDGTYRVVAVADVDGNLSPLVALAAQPSLGDIAGRAGTSVVVSGDAAWAGDIELTDSIPCDPPVFRFEPEILAGTDFPASMTLTTQAVLPLGITEDSAQIPVRLRGQDEDGDNLPDVYPRVFLSLMSPGGDAASAEDDPRHLVIPALVNPLPFLAALDRGEPFVLTKTLPLILPPVAMNLETQAIERPIPAGRYRVHVLSGTGQTWSVPNTLNDALGWAETTSEDQSQVRVVEVSSEALPLGVITGRVRGDGAWPAGDFQVVVAAYGVHDLEPPRGDRVPAATAVVSGDRIRPTGSTSYRLTGLATGAYQVEAFLDTGDDFVPWFSVMRQPNEGDVGGGYLDLGSGRLRTVVVEALGAPASGVDVDIKAAKSFTHDPPAFFLPDRVTLEGPTGTVSVLVSRLTETNIAFSVHGSLRVGWFDRDGDGLDDDVDGDGEADVFPTVVADRLDPSDSTRQKLAEQRVRIRGWIDPAQFPALDRVTNPVVDVPTVVVSFSSTAWDLANPGQSISPPAGEYRVTLINEAGQAWSSPNPLADAAGTRYALTQGRSMGVQE